MIIDNKVATEFHQIVEEPGRNPGRYQDTFTLEYDGNRWITNLTTDEMKCIDECKNGTDKEEECACDMSDTENVVDTATRKRVRKPPQRYKAK
jgi:hypothetical protein